MKCILKPGCLAFLLLHAFTSQAVLTVTKISAGGIHSLFLKSDGSLWGMGDNGNGELGGGYSISTTNRPVQIVSNGVTTIAAGQFHSLFRMSDGSLWAMGYNFYGQLGDGSNTNHYFPELIVSNQVGLIAAGYYHSLFAKFHNPAGPGSFWGMGEDFFGQLGDITIIQTNQPYQILSVAHSTAVSAIAAGEDFSLFVEPDGSLWGMGWNVSGQLGDGTTNDSPVRELIESNNVTAIAAGYQHSLFLMSDGSLWAMGSNAQGQLGVGSTNGSHIPVEIMSSNVTAIAAGGYHSLFIKSDGSLWAMGYNRYCQLGDGTTNDSHFPEQIVSTGVTAIAAGANHSLTLGLEVTNGFAGRTYVTLTGTNMTQPLNQWSPIATNVLGADGPFTVTATNGVDPNAAQQYYLIELQ